MCKVFLPLYLPCKGARKFPITAMCTVYFAALIALSVRCTALTLLWNISFPPNNWKHMPNLFFSQKTSMIVTEATENQTDLGKIQGIDPKSGAVVWSLDQRTFAFDRDIIDPVTGLLATMNDTYVTAISTDSGETKWVWKAEKDFRVWNSAVSGDYFIITESTEVCFQFYLLKVSNGDSTLRQLLCRNDDYWFIVYGNSSEYALLWLDYFIYVNLSNANFINTSVKPGFQNAIANPKKIVTCTRETLALTDEDDPIKSWQFDIPSGSCSFMLPIFTPQQQLIFNDDQSLIFLAVENPTFLYVLEISSGKMLWSVAGPKSTRDTDHFYFPCYTNGLIYIFNGYEEKYSGFIPVYYLFHIFVYDAITGEKKGQHDFDRTYNWILDAPPVCGIGNVYLVTRDGIELPGSYLYGFSP
jgi:outer membrane protein assembly factor BamB